MNELPDFTINGEWPDAWGNYAPMAGHNRKIWILNSAEEIKVWRDWFVESGCADAWDGVDDIEAKLDRDD